MSRWEDDLVDPFLADVPEEFSDELARSVDAEVRPSGALRDAILAAASTDGRFDRFVAVVAELLDLPAPRAGELLDGIARPESWVPGMVPGMTLYHVEGGPKVRGHATGFTRLPQGFHFPEHTHLGDERILVIQGSFEDGVTGAVYRPGDLVGMPADSTHDFRVRPGPALVYLIVLETGVKIGDLVVRAEDPNL